MDTIPTVAIITEDMAAANRYPKGDNRKKRIGSQKIPQQGKNARH
jgi:hypothetical protein